MTIRQSTADDRSDRMDDVPRREIVPLRDLRRSRLLGMPLHLHQRSACRAQRQPRRRVNRIVNAAVSGDEAAEESRVGRVDDRVRREARDVALPEGNTRIRGDGWERHDIHHAACLALR